MKQQSNPRTVCTARDLARMAKNAGAVYAGRCSGSGVEQVARG